MGFGPRDGFLYIAMGDSGGGGDPGEAAQDISNVLGSILRIDVDGDLFPDDPDRNYSIPNDNPFYSCPGGRPNSRDEVGADEIFAYGVRNPYRCAFDPVSGDLYIADVGQDRREEVSVLQSPFQDDAQWNLGWDCFEGSLVFETDNCGTGRSVPPVIEYVHELGRCSITGGEVYRGCNLPEFTGRYFYGDFCSGETFSARLSFSIDDPVSLVEVANHTDGVGRYAFDLVTYGRDFYGEIYLSDRDGQVYRIMPAAGFDDLNANAIDDDCERCNAADFAPSAGEFGSLDFFDIDAFVAAFLAGSAAADLDGSGGQDFDDISAFVEAFLGGCP